MSFSTQCGKCLHLKLDDGVCKAFPDGIPEEILIGKHDHTKPYRGDKGILFESAEKEG